MKVLKFGAIWCTECLVMRPMWEEIEKELPDLKTEYVDADDNNDLFEKYGVKDIPVAIIVNDNGEEILRLEGVQNKEELIKIVKEKME